ncbi:MAG: zinc ribbon domain-containing protein [Candidatus Heimdallarchaeota archaeon]
MSIFCTNCGKPLKKEYEYCIHCGKTLVNQASVKIHSNKVYSVTSKRDSKYILNSSEREIFLQRILPTILMGSIIWLISEILFSVTFMDYELTESFLIYYISTLIIEALLVLILYFASKANRTFIGIAIFFIFSFIGGFLSLPIIMITEFLPQVHMFVTLSLGGTLVTCFLGSVLRENYFGKGYLWAHILLFLVGTTLIEVIFLLIFKIQNFLLTIPISVAYILVISLTEMFYGAKAVKNSSDQNWIYTFFKVEGILLLALLIGLIAVVVVLVIVGLGIACGDSGFDFSGFSSGGSRSKRQKKTHNP